MSLAFEITAEDVQTALSHNLQLNCGSIVAEKLLAKIDQRRIEWAALQGDDLEDQTLYAHEEIVKVLTDLGWVAFDIHFRCFRVADGL